MKRRGACPQRHGNAAPSDPVTTQHAINKYDCGLRSLAHDTGLPDEGEYGKNAVAETVKTASTACEPQDLGKNGPPGRPQDGGAVHNTAKRTDTALAGPAQAIMAALLACGMLNIGETPPSPGGRLAWSLTITDPITGMAA